MNILKVSRETSLTSLSFTRFTFVTLSHNNTLCHAYTIEELIDGAAFMELSESDVKSLVKPLGQVKKISRLISSKANPGPKVKVCHVTQYLMSHSI